MTDIPAALIPVPPPEDSLKSLRPSRTELLSLLRAVQDSSSASIESIASLASQAGLLPTPSVAVAPSGLAPISGSPVSPHVVSHLIPTVTSTPGMDTGYVANAGTSDRAVELGAGEVAGTQNVGGIVGGSVGGSLLLLLLAVAGVLIRRRRAKAAAARGLLPSAGGGTRGDEKHGGVHYTTFGHREDGDGAKFDLENGERARDSVGTRRGTMIFPPDQAQSPSQVTDSKESVESKALDEEQGKELVKIPPSETVQSLRRPGEPTYLNLTRESVYSGGSSLMSLRSDGEKENPQAMRIIGEEARRSLFFDYGTVSTVGTGSKEYTFKA